MKSYSFYHRDTGLLKDVVFSTDDETQLVNNIPADHVALEGQHDALSKRVDVRTGLVIDYQPPSPSPEHEWNADTGRWQISAAVQAKAQARAAAMTALAALDIKSIRTLRELALGVAGAHDRLAAIEAAVAAERAKLFSPD
jgi:hypothetical protein